MGFACMDFERCTARPLHPRHSCTSASKPQFSRTKIDDGVGATMANKKTLVLAGGTLLACSIGKKTLHKGARHATGSEASQAVVAPRIHQSFCASTALNSDSSRL